MTDPRDGRDPEIAEALARIPVPEYEPGFWDQLEARLAEPGEGTVVPLARRRAAAGGRNRRGATIVLAAAAAVVVAVLAVQLVADDGDPVRTADLSTSSTVAISALAGQHVPSRLGATGSASTPQDAFASWVRAIDEGDEATVRALTGPRTVAYYEALGADPYESAQGWERWAGDEDRRLDVIDFGEVEGVHVAGLLIEGTADPTVEGYPDAATTSPDHDAVVLVEGDRGWLVEPAAFDPDGESRLEVIAPEPGEHGLGALAPAGPVRLQVASAGVHYVGVDQGRLRGFAPGDAEDGVISWFPDRELTPGEHLLVVAHLSPDVLVLNALPFTVSEPIAP